MREGLKNFSSTLLLSSKGLVAQSSAAFNTHVEIILDLQSANAELVSGLLIIALLEYLNEP